MSMRKKDALEGVICIQSSPTTHFPPKHHTFSSILGIQQAPLSYNYKKRKQEAVPATTTNFGLCLVFSVYWMLLSL